MFLKGIFIAIASLVLDQLHKWYMLEIVDIDQGPAISVAPFLNFVMVWNRGVSFGMGQNTANAHLIFSIVAIIIVIGLLIWLKNCKSAILGVALGLIVGGAIGNVIDRIRFNAVADFFDFHIAGYHWPAFNIADSAVFIGAIMIFIDSFVDHNKKEENNE